MSAIDHDEQGTKEKEEVYENEDEEEEEEEEKEEDEDDGRIVRSDGIVEEAYVMVDHYRMNTLGDNSLADGDRGRDESSSPASQVTVDVAVHEEQAPSSTGFAPHIMNELVPLSFFSQPWRALIASIFISCCMPMTYGSFEVFVVQVIAPSLLGLDTIYSALYLGLFFLLLAPLNLLVARFAKQLEDRTGLVTCLSSTIIALALLFVFTFYCGEGEKQRVTSSPNHPPEVSSLFSSSSSSSNASSIFASPSPSSHSTPVMTVAEFGAIFSALSVIALLSLNIARGLAWSLTTKLPSINQKDRVGLLCMSIYFVSRGLGAVLGSLVQDPWDFFALLLIINGPGLALVLLFFSRLKEKET